MKIQIYGYFHTRGSVPIVASNWIIELSKHHQVKVLDYYNQGCNFESILPFIGEYGKKEAPVGIFFGYPSLMKEFGLLVNKNAYKVGVFVSETDLSQIELSYLGQVRWSKICVPSVYCQNLFRRSADCKEPLVVNHGLDPEFYINREVPKKEKFTFLYIFNNSPTGGTVERKNLQNLMTASDMANLLVTIKTDSSINLDIDVLERTHKNIKFEMRHMNISELVDFYKSHHAYVNPTRAEGFGLTALEAMACGLPVVSPIHTGLTEFLCESNCVSIKCQPGSAASDYFRYATNNGKIFRINPVDIADSMKECYKNYDRYKNIAIAQRPYIMERFSWEKALQPFASWIQTLQQ